MRKSSFFPIASSLAVILLAASAPAFADHDHDKGHADKMAAEHKHDQPAPTPAAAIEPRQAVKTEEVTYATLEGKQIKGYLARPEKATGPLPGLLVIHEWWGLNDNVRAMTRRLAGEGYQALALDLYEGKVAGKPEEAEALMEDSLTRIMRLMDNIRQGYTYLGENLAAPKVGVIGWCYGGGWSLETALNVPGLDAAVMYYGRIVLDEAELKDLASPLLGLFGEKDASLPLETVKAFEAKLKQLGKDATIVIYPGADHAFANASGGNYKADAAEDAWKRTTEHFARHLR
jgi:carboxymethylenebutenolidase